MKDTELREAGKRMAERSVQNFGREKEIHELTQEQKASGAGEISGAEGCLEVQESTGTREIPLSPEGTGEAAPLAPLSGREERHFPRYRILFVSNSTSGRSLMAESMMRVMVKRLGVEDDFEIRAAAAGRRGALPGIQEKSSAAARSRKAALRKMR